MNRIKTCLSIALSTLATIPALAGVTSGELMKSYLAKEAITSKMENGLLIFALEGATFFVRDLANNHIIKILVPSDVTGLNPASVKQVCERLNNEMAVLKFLPNDGYVAISYEGLIPEKLSTADIQKIIKLLLHSERMLQQQLRK